jgi:putative FmdB family regulatory protein
MPIYEFICSKGHKTERILSRLDGENTLAIQCPKCGETANQQLALPFPGHFHGSPEGWYKPSPAAKRVVNPDNTTFAPGKHDPKI